jgi:hypothetical protein
LINSSNLSAAQKATIGFKNRETEEQTNQFVARMLQVANIRR